MPLKTRSGRSRLLKRSPGSDTAVPIAPDTAHGISILRAIVRSESEGDRASSRIQVRYCEFDLAFDRLEQHRTGAEIGPVGRCLAWLRTLGAND